MLRKSSPRNVSEEELVWGSAVGELVTVDGERDFGGSGALLGLVTLDPNNLLCLVWVLAEKTYWRVLAGLPVLDLNCRHLEMVTTLNFGALNVFIFASNTTFYFTR